MTDMTMTGEPDLAALLGSRICHDLISPIGAIGNGVELLLLEGGTPGPELAMVADSVANANARIRYFRIGFGAASEDQRIGRAEVMSIFADLTRGGRLSVDWDSPADLSRAETRLAFLMVMCCENALAFGGRIAVRHHNGSWEITATAPRMRCDPTLWALLTDPAARADISPALVHFALAPRELVRLKRTASVTIEDSRISIRF